MKEGNMTVSRSGLALGCAAAFALSACSSGVPDDCMLTDAEFQKSVETKSVVTGYDHQWIGQTLILSPQMKMVKRSDDETQTLIQARNNLCASATPKNQ